VPGDPRGRWPSSPLRGGHETPPGPAARAGCLAPKRPAGSRAGRSALDPVGDHAPQLFAMGAILGGDGEHFEHCMRWRRSPRQGRISPQDSQATLGPVQHTALGLVYRRCCDDGWNRSTRITHRTSEPGPLRSRPQTPISARMASAAARGSVAAVIGRPTTR
jgi:hypothetical protein